MLADFPGNPINILWGFPLALLVWIGLPVCLVCVFYRAAKKARLRRKFLCLPQHLVRKLNNFPECSFGSHRVTLILRDARLVPEVVVAAGALREVEHKPVNRPEDLNFDIKDVVDVC